MIRDMTDKYGARPLRRTIQNLVEDRMAEEMLDGRIKAGSLVEVGFDGEKLTFSVESKDSQAKGGRQTSQQTSRQTSLSRGRF